MAQHGGGGWGLCCGLKNKKNVLFLCGNSTEQKFLIPARMQIGVKLLTTKVTYFYSFCKFPCSLSRYFWIFTKVTCPNQRLLDVHLCIAIKLLDTIGRKLTFYMALLKLITSLTKVSL